MSKRQLLQTAEAIERRSRRLCREMDREHAEWMKEVMAYMKTNGVGFNDAWVACGGGTIIPLLGIKFGKPLSNREVRELERQDREWHREIVAYMEANGVDYDTAFVKCGGTIIPDALPEGEPA